MSNTANRESGEPLAQQFYIKQFFSVSKRHKEEEFRCVKWWRGKLAKKFKPEVSDSEFLMLIGLMMDRIVLKLSVCYDLNNWSNTSSSSNLSSTRYEINSLNVFDNGWNSFKPKGLIVMSLMVGERLNLEIWGRSCDWKSPKGF